MQDRDARIAGGTLFVGVVQFTMAMILAEIYYPDYNVSLNTISNLGVTCRPTCQVYQPSSTLFTVSVVALGIFVVVSSYFLYRAFRSKPITTFLLLAGMGAVGVGIFPESTGVVHSIFTLVAFLFAGLSPIAAYRLERPPLSYFSIVLGLMALGSLVLRIQHIYLGLGTGGMERMVVYPAILWSIGFGGSLMSRDVDG